MLQLNESLMSLKLRALQLERRSPDWKKFKRVSRQCAIGPLLGIVPAALHCLHQATSTVDQIARSQVPRPAPTGPDFRMVVGSGSAALLRQLVHSALEHSSDDPAVLQQAADQLTR